MGTRYRNYSEEWLLDSDFYSDNVLAMTSEKLHSKSDIAAELAWRDEQLAKANERIAELEKELTLSTDQNDLVLDEFIRVKHLTDNTEIHQLCERAHLRMRQNVSVIDRNYKLERKVSQLNQRCAELDSIADTAFKYNHSSAECLRAWNKLQQLRKEQE